VKFGAFLADLMEDLELSPWQLADLMGVSYNAVKAWLKREVPPKGEGLSKLADALNIPLGTLRAAIDGKSRLPREYRTPKASETLVRKAKVWKWFQSVPKPVQHVILMERPAEGMEQDYLRHVTEYFKQRLAANDKGGKKRAG
jgi:transcriptional regulator with XRE-family HTH domain